MMGAQSIEFWINPLEVYVVYPLTVLGITTLAGFLTSLQIRKINPSETSNIE
jgi:putative ABC transport system permease protein